MEYVIENESLLRMERCGVKIDNIIWCSETRNNGLYKIKVENHEIEFVSEFPVDGYSWLFADVILKEEEEVFFIPCEADELAIYNIRKNCFQIIHIDKKEKERFAFGVMDTGNLYIFPEYGSQIIKVNTVSKKVTYIRQIIKDLKYYFSLEEDEDLFYTYYLYKNKIYLPLLAKNVLVECDFELERFETYTLDEYENIGIRDCFGANEILYLLSCYGTVYEFNLETKVKRKLFSVKDNTIEPYGFIVLYKNELWLTPFWKENIVIYDIVNDKLSFLDIVLPEYTQCISKNRLCNKEKIKFSKVFYEDGKIWMYPREIDVVVEADMETRNMKSFIPYLPIERRNNLFIFLGKMEKNSLGEKMNQNVCGEEIWQVVKE